MRKIALSSAVLILAATGFSQTETTNKKLTFGFNMGTSYSNIRAKKTNDVINMKISNGAGFNLGIILNYKMTPKLSFAPKAELTFNDNKVLLSRNNGDNETYQINPSTIDLCSHFTYVLSDTKLKPYIILGPSFKTPLITQKTSLDKETPLPTNKSSNLTIDIGLGINKKLTYFDIAPEIRYSYGLVNLSGIQGLKNLNYHTISLIVNFKG